MKSKVPLIVLLVVIFTGAIAIKFFSDIPEAEQVNAAAVGKQGNSSVSGNALEMTSGYIKHEASPLMPESSSLKIVAVGDVMLGRGVGSRLESQKKGYIYPFAKVSSILKKGDIVFGNLEAPVTDRTHSLDARYKYVLKNKPSAILSLVHAGFNIMNLANNHTMDYYAEGLRDTIGYLDRMQISHAGAGASLDEARKPALVEKKGIKIGMLSYTDMAEIVYRGQPQIMYAASAERTGVVPLKYEYISEDMKKLRDKVDLLIVSLHWGVEESFEITAGQVELAHKLLDEGADIIIGHHPHQFQGIEIYKGKPVFYSLGNFIFDQNDPENQEGFIINMDYKDKKLAKLAAIPVRTFEKTQVLLVEGQDAAELLKRQKELSMKIGTSSEIVDNMLTFKLD